MTPKSGNRFSEKTMLHNMLERDPKPTFFRDRNIARQTAVALGKEITAKREWRG
jgi:hypothetical protein